MPTLIEIIGEEKWKEVMQKCGGQVFRIPKYHNRPEEIERRNKQIKEKYHQLRSLGIDRESSIKTLMAEFGVCRSVIEHLL